MKPLIRALALASCATSLAGCMMVGPDFQRPDAVAPAHWNLAAQAHDSPRSLVTSDPVETRWWRAFHDARLVTLIERAAASNLDVQAATERLAQARAIRGVTDAAALPSLNGSASYQHARSSRRGLLDVSGLNGETDYNLWQPGFDASWELDLWGRVRRLKEAARANAQASEEMRRDVLVSVFAELARNYVQLRGVQAGQAILRDNLDIARHSEALTQIRFKDGVATRLEVAEATAQVRTIEAQLPLFEAQRARRVNALGYLLGEPPGALDALLAAAEPIPVTPPVVPAGLPSELAERRPDIREAEARLHAATADIGVARGSFYPRITLSANVALQAMHSGDLGEWSARMFGIGPALSVPIFDGGRLKGQLALRTAQQREAMLAFRRTVLAAWHEIDDAMTEYAARQHHGARLAEAIAQDRVALEQAHRQYVAGATDFLNVLTVQQALLKDQQARVTAATDEALALIGLFKALGGGWETAFPVAEAGGARADAR
ncbi:efflux transporter outer membrane subunit [Burkholderia sp. FERM BP-3421]|uniref:efflux transporter outer membrane subunit n=1 Tax=Burkholderia sp. FERM BP-3421 TaxID=1494466 RepID=UPI002360B96B|nr:efflux transporter outer membrane subunit [Burkholderia sp. FERM BP-3421]WDD93002.1 efflux transporter outer membrane subunit [Burkholderia sp. FERM BP-3421]